MTSLMDGRMEITLAGHPATLVPTLGAAMELCRRHGSFMALLSKLADLDLNAAIDVVRLGLGRPESEHGLLAQQVFEGGLTDLMPHLSAYVFTLANGGRPRKDEGGDDDASPFVG